MDRSTLIDTQYRPVTQAETQAEDAASVRVGRDLALGCNNAFARACAPHLSDMWPFGASGFISTSANDTDEHVVGEVMRFPAVHCGYGGHYTHAAWSAFCYIGGTSNNCTVRLYSAEHYYRGPSDMTTATKALLGANSSDSSSFTSADGEWYSSGDEALLLHPNKDGETYFLMTAQFAAASVNNIIILLTASVTLGRGELAVIL